MVRNIPSVAIVIGLLLIAVAFAAGKSVKSDFDMAQEDIIMRNVSHHVLRYTGDSTSQISPVVRLSAYEFQLPFERSFPLKPDSLVDVIDRTMSGSTLPAEYVVNVREKRTQKLIYGYARLSNGKKSILPCLGRTLPELPYYIEVRFRPGSSNTAKGFYIGGLSILVIGFLTFGFSRSAKGKKLPGSPVPETIPVKRHEIPIGKYIFLADERILKLDGQDTILTIKEAKILGIFAHAPNQVIDRQRLQKEIWEDEGVIVGRSLDMFISRLRKKLEGDPDVKLTNIHSQGYKLEVGGR